MLGDAHRQAAMDIEQTIVLLGDPVANPYIGRGLIELYWGAAFHWIAYGCQQKHAKHKENHTKLGRFLRDFSEMSVADLWDPLDELRRGGWYGHHNLPNDVIEARRLWQEIRAWAQS